MTKILTLFLFSIIAIVLLLPSNSQATAHVYTACTNINPNTGDCDAPVQVCYEGFVPCGVEKPCWKNSNVVGNKCDPKTDPVMTSGRKETFAGVPCQICHIFVMINGIVQYILINIIPPLAVLMLIVGGVMYYFSRGNPALLEKSRKLIEGVLIGLALIYGAYMIVGILLSILGVAQWTGLGSWASQGPFSLNCYVLIQ